MDESPEWTRLYTALGRITFAWSMIDTYLDQVNYRLYHKFGGREIEPVLPHSSLEMKIAYLRKVATETSMMDEEQRRIGVDMADKLAQMRDERHWMIHGACSKLEGESLTFLRTRLKLKQQERKTVTFADLQDFYGRSLTVVLGLCLFLLLNLRTLTPEEVKKLFGAFAEEHGATLEVTEELGKLRD